MDIVAEELAESLVKRLELLPPTSRLLVGLAGIPASGKSTLALLIIAKVNNALKTQYDAPLPAEGTRALPRGDQAILVGLDGWHLTRSQLDGLPDPKLAHDRRGAHWTFDGAGYVEFVKELRKPLSIDDAEAIEVITAPSFDHAVKDPVPDSVLIHPYHRLVLIEGLYTFLSIEPWAEAAKLLDERWFIDVDVDVASDRLVKRHVLTGVAKDMPEAIWRSTENDMPNGQFITSNILEPTRRIQSIQDGLMAA